LVLRLLGRDRGDAEQANVNHSGAIQVIEDAGWYRNDAHDPDTEGPASPGPRAAAPSANEGGGVRPAVG
jgi:hypothetical protein